MRRFPFLAVQATLMPCVSSLAEKPRCCRNGSSGSRRRKLHKTMLEHRRYPAVCLTLPDSEQSLTIPQTMAQAAHRLSHPSPRLFGK